MCGRYGRWSDPEWLIEEFSDLQLPAIPFPPTYNAAPQSQQPVLRLNPHTGQPELVPMRWGLIPFWAGPGAFNRLTFNARAEELSQKPTFRDALKSRRCLVPADGHCQVGLEKSDVGVLPAVPGRPAGGASWLSGSQTATVSRHVSNRLCRSAW
jgi:putative SOS response-associated peptidase YedK